MLAELYTVQDQHAELDIYSSLKQVEIVIHSDVLLSIRTYYCDPESISLLFLSVMCVAEKRQIPIS